MEFIRWAKTNTFYLKLTLSKLKPVKCVFCNEENKNQKACAVNYLWDTVAEEINRSLKVMGFSIKTF